MAMRARPSVMPRSAPTLKLAPCSVGTAGRLGQRHHIGSACTSPADDVVGQDARPGPGSASNCVLGHAQFGQGRGEGVVGRREDRERPGAATACRPGWRPRRPRPGPRSVGFDCAICTTSSTPGGTSTLSMTWITPLLAATSARGHAGLVQRRIGELDARRGCPRPASPASPAGKLYSVAWVAPPAPASAASCCVGSTW